MNMDDLKQDNLDTPRVPDEALRKAGLRSSELVLRLRSQANDLAIMQNLKPYAKLTDEAADRIFALQEHFRQLGRLYRLGCVKLVDAKPIEVELWEWMLKDGTGDEPQNGLHERPGANT
jgi:hypothetical protein